MTDQTSGIESKTWDAAILEGTALLRDCARRGAMLTYTDFQRALKSILLQNPRDPKLHRLLGEISRQEDRAGRGMLSAVVVAKDTNLPGAGFFTLARQLGYRFADETQFWRDELEKIRRVE